ncbi:DUF6466 family protein [Bifidobacterium thermophilum]|uniref:DUF6466 family protein n=1 Tax=Bifidobacterium thermophilum TaxID=33905 RepID=UPI0030B6D874
MSDTPQRPERRQTPRRHARAPLAVRIILAALAAAALAGAVLAVANIQAQDSYNQATRSLNADLKASASPTADWSTLAARQEQADAQFKEAQSWSAVLAPNLKTSIETNSAISRTLTKRIQAELATQQSGSPSSHNSANASPSDPAGSPSPSSSDGLSDEQRRKVQDLLESNKSASPSPSSSSTTNSTTPSPGATVKPW